MSIVWPLGLPQIPLIDGYEGGPPNRLLVSQMDSGEAKTRRLGPRADTVPVKYLLDDSQKVLLREFAVGTLRDCSLWFDWPDPDLGDYVRSRIVPMKDRLYKIVPQGGIYWIASMHIMYWPNAPLT